LLLSGTARAHADALAEERAHTLFVAGRVAARAGDDALACTNFAASLELHRTLGTLLNLAMCEEHLGRLADSYQHFDAFLQEADLDDDRRELARSHAEELLTRVARLFVRVDPGVSAALVTVDGESVDLDGRVPLVLIPGGHRLSVRIGDQAAQAVEMNLAAGSETTLAVPWVMPESSRPANPPPRAPESTSGTQVALAPARPAARVDSTRRTAGWVVTGVGLAALAASAGMGIGILHEKGVVESHCPGGHCDAEGWSAGKTGRTLVTAGTATLVIGSIAAGTGIYLLVAPSWSTRNRAAVVGVGAPF
jgi:hypothetical protein